ERRGYYGAGLGVALYTVTNIIVFGVLIGWSAKSLHQADAARVRLAAQQRDSEAQVRLLLDSTAEAIYGIDADGHCTFINSACVRMLGYADSQELLGKDMHALIHYARPDGTPYPVEECHIYQAVRTDTPTHVDDEVFWRADGTRFAAEYWSYPMRRHGQLVGAVVTFLDITARKQAEERLRHSEERTRAIIESASDAFIAIDADGIVIGWNQQAETMFGWSRDEAVGRRLSDMILPARHRAPHEHGLRRFAATGEGPVLNKRIEITALRRCGEKFPVELAIWPVLADGIHTFNAFVHDITERKRAADSILALNAELNANTVQLQQTNRELEAFSYTISHDLRAPLRHIDGYARMLHEDAGDQLDAEMRRYLDTISDSARQMGALIDDLLAFSRLGRKPVERTDVDMDALVSRVVHELGAGGAGDGRVSVGQLPAANADPVLLKQVWVNLLSNALKYSAPRGDDARIEISGEHGDGIVRYRICDNGAGFDMRYADKLFGVFQRLHSQDEFEGTGVGLAIVQRIVIRHGGTIGAQAEPGRGATFTFELPIIGGQCLPDGRDVPADSATEAPA
ncbi:MAG: PAS domain-containing sensor histidine kinase, partial [Lysobacter sp.]